MFRSMLILSTACIKSGCFSLNAVSLSISVMYFSKLFRVFPTRIIVDIFYGEFKEWELFMVDLSSYSPERYEIIFSR